MWTAILCYESWSRAQRISGKQQCCQLFVGIRTITEEMRPEPTQQVPMLEDTSTVFFTLRDLLVYFLRLGAFGFGGPIALAGHMQKDLVEERHWVAKADYLE